MPALTVLFPTNNLECTNMKGDVIVLEEHHIRAASAIVPHIVEAIAAKTQPIRHHGRW